MARGKRIRETKKHCVLCGVGLPARARGKGVKAFINVGKKSVIVKVYFCQNCWCRIVGETNRQHAVMLSRLRV